MRWSIASNPKAFPPPRGAACRIIPGYIAGDPRRSTKRKVVSASGVVTLKVRSVAARVEVLLHVADRRAAPLLEQPEAALRVLDLEHHRPDAVGVLAEVAPRAPALAERLGADDPHVARLEHRAALPPRPLEVGPARRDLGEVEAVEVEAAAPLEVVDVVVERLDAAQAERGELRGHGVLRSGLGASGCRSGWADWNGASARQASSIRSSVGYGATSTANRRAL